MTKERWAQIGITIQFLIIVRTLGEIFRLKYFHGPSFSVAVAMPYIGGVLIAAFACWLSVSFYFFRRFAVSAWISLTAVLVLFGYKIGMIGR